MIDRSLALVAVCAAATATAMPAQGFVTTALAGTPIGPAGDVTGDGVGDLLVQIGSNFVVLDGITRAPIPWLQRSAANSAQHYTPVGDYDGDGKDDLAYWLFGSTVAPIVSGADGRTLLNLSMPLGGQSRLGGGTDFDGDGRADLFYAGGSDAFIRSSRTGAILRQLFGNQSSMGPWYTAARPAGDADGDGCGDVLVDYDTYIFHGYLCDLQFSSGGSSALDQAEAVGDVTGDGKADFWMAWAPGSGSARIVNGGAPTAVVWSMPYTQAWPLGDVDGDGFADIATEVWNGTSNDYQPLSGATHAPMTGPVLGSASVPLLLGDIDGDGRSENWINGLLHDWSDASLPSASRMLRRGVIGTTSDGRRPNLVTRGHCGLGHTAFFDMRGGMPNGYVFLVYGNAIDVDLANLGAPGNRCYTSIAGILPFVANNKGIAQYRVTVPVTPSLLGTTLSLQSAVVDPAANALGLVASNAIDLTVAN